MRVLYFHQHFSTPDGSAGIRSYQMARKLVSQGHQVTMVCGSYGGGKTGLTQAFRFGKRVGQVDGIDVIEFDLAYSNRDGFVKRTSLFLLFALRSVIVALTAKYDLVFATTTPLTAGIPGIFARWIRFKPFVFEVRDLWPELPKAMGVISNPVVLGAMSVLEWLSYRSAHQCIGLSPGIVDGIVARGVAKEKVKLIPNGCDLDIFGNGEAQRPEGVLETDLMAIFAGTHGIANGLDSALDAALKLIQLGRTDIKLVLIGSGKLKSHLVARASDENLSNVLFFDPVNKSDLSKLLAGADIGLQLLANIPAFYYGTSPNKFFDYIAAGLPVLNNYPGWIAELVTANQCGFSVGPEDSDQFAAALVGAADNKSKLIGMGLNSRRLAERDFDRDLLAANWVNVIEGVINEARN